jgi:hypothetical protein
MAPMTNADGWRPLSTPKSRAGAEAFHLSPFARLARSHVFAAAGDALVTIALANSLFFDLDPNDARWKVFLYLALTMAPLAVVAPFIGPFLDRAKGGRRWMIIGAHAVRALVCLVMLNDLDSLLLFPEAFTVLALGKAYGVARSAVVPTVVRSDDELVEANSKMQLLSGLAAPAAAVPAGLAFLIAGSPGVLFLAVLSYSVATLAALRIPATKVADAPATAAEAAELRGVGILLASSAMGLIRGIVGFLTFFLLFQLREDPTWHMGVVLGLTGAGALLGSALAPKLREAMPEERMLLSALAFTVVVALGVARYGGLAGAAAMAAVVAIVSTSAKLAFDSLVQRDAPDANRGRSFARFEVRFQLVWVVGAVLPVAIDMPMAVGYLVIAGTAGFALFSYVVGQRAAHRGEPPPRIAAPLAPQDPKGGEAPATTPAPPGPDPTTVDPTRVDRTLVQPTPPQDDPTTR